MARHIFLGLGSNLGDRAAWLAEAREHLESDKTITVLQASSVYETAAHGLQKQPAFLNQVLEVATKLVPVLLLESLLRIENQLGRVRAQRWGPRNIDLDLLAYRDIEITSERLCVPHPEIPKRRFVLAPWREIAPDFMLPKWQRSVAELFARCEDDCEVRLWQDTRSTSNFSI